MKTIFVLLVIASIFYGIYSAALAVWSYFEISNLVEEVVPREMRKLGAASGWEKADRMRKLRESILRGAEQSGISLDPKAVAVTEEDGAVWVRVKSSYPIIRFRGETMLTIPISTAHSFPASPN